MIQIHYMSNVPLLKPGNSQAQNVPTIPDMPIPYNLGQAKTIRSDSDCVIKDLEIPDPDTGKIMWTSSHITIKPGKQGPQLRVVDADIKYYIMQGDVWFMINYVGRIVTAGDFIVVRRGKHHTVMNKSDKSEAILQFEYPGKLNRKRLAFQASSSASVSERESSSEP